MGEINFKSSVPDRRISYTQWFKEQQEVKNAQEDHDKPFPALSQKSGGGAEPLSTQQALSALESQSPTFNASRLLFFVGSFWVAIKRE